MTNCNILHDALPYYPTFGGNGIVHLDEDTYILSTTGCCCYPRRLFCETMWHKESDASFHCPEDVMLTALTELLTNWDDKGLYGREHVLYVIRSASHCTFSIVK